MCADTAYKSGEVFAYRDMEPAQKNTRIFIGFAEVKIYFHFMVT
jgi:hypothetical protein